MTASKPVDIFSVPQISPDEIASLGEKKASENQHQTSY